MLISLLCIIYGVYFLYKRKLNILTYGMYLVNPAVVALTIPVVIAFKRYLAILLLLLYLKDLYINQKKKKKIYYHFPLKVASWIMFISSILVISFDNRFEPIHRVLYPLMDALDVYFPLFLTYFFTLKYHQYIGEIKNPNIICSYIVFAYAMIQVIGGVDFINDFIFSMQAPDDSYDEVVQETFRGFRVKSFYRYTFDLGYNGSLFVLTALTFIILKGKASIFQIICMVCGLGCVVLSGSRTVLLSALFSILVLFMMTKISKVKIKVVLGTLAFGLLIYLFVPPVTNLVDVSIGSILLNDDKSQIEGSSVDMRIGQLIGTIAMWAKHPILGNGFKYIFLELGWKSNEFVGDMFGYESLLFNVLIERGLVGLIAYTIFIYSIFRYFFKNRKYNRALSSMGISIITVFTLFAIGTGALDSWFNTMAILGVLMGSIESLKRTTFSRNVVMNREVPWKCIGVQSLDRR